MLFIRVLGNGTQIDQSQGGIDEVHCDPGDITISGFGEYVVSLGDNIGLIFDHHSFTSNKTYTAELVFNESGPGSVAAEAICFDNPPFRP